MYLDHNATAPLRPVAREALLSALDGAWGNPGSPHAVGRAAAAALDRARAQVAGLCGWDPRGVVFTSGATEANALALTGAAHAARPLVITSAVEHPSALAWADHTVPVDTRGVVDLAALDTLLSEHGPQVGVVSVMAANNETGVLQPVAEVARRAQAVGAWAHCDATQLAGRLPMDLPVDLLTLSSHKLGGPRGAGALLVRPATMPRLQPLLRGGPQERGLRAGTESVPALAGFGAAAAAAAAEAPLPTAPQAALEAALVGLGADILGAGAPRLPNTTAALFPHPGDLVVMALDLAGVQASTGSACSSGAAQESHVIRAMGRRGTPVRLSWGREGLDVPALTEILAAVLDRMEGACAS